MRWRCGIDAVWMRLRRARGRVIFVSRAYLGCISGVSRVYLGRISGVSRVYLGRISGVSRLEGERELVITHVEMGVNPAARDVRNREGIGRRHLGGLE